MSQTFQNPYWVLAGNPSKLFKNTTPSNFPTLPFFTPPSGIGGITYPARLQTAVNGVFDECGNPLFYVAGDWVLDEDGITVGELEYKDGWTKAYSPLIPYFFDNPVNDLTPQNTQNFEAVVCEVPAEAGEYFIFCSESRPSGSRVFVYQYDAIGKTLSTEEQITITYDDDFNPLGLPSTRFALSKYDEEQGRVLYVLGRKGLARIPIGTSVTQASDLEGETILYYPDAGTEPCPELELSHDGKTLAWATYDGNSSLIHFFDIASHQHTTFEPGKNTMDLISGLEFLPDGRLAASLSWNGAILQNLNGIGYFNTALTSFYHVSSSASYQGGMIELGISNSSTWSLYGISTQNLVRIPFVGSTPPSISNTIPFSGQYYVASFGLVYAHGLPDQVDGEAYPYSTCGGGDPNPESVELPSEEIDSPSFSFTPLLTIINHE